MASTEADASSGAAPPPEEPPIKVSDNSNSGNTSTGGTKIKVSLGLTRKRKSNKKSKSQKDQLDTSFSASAAQQHSEDDEFEGGTIADRAAYLSRKRAATANLGDEGENGNEKGELVIPLPGGGTRQRKERKVPLLMAGRRSWHHRNHRTDAVSGNLNGNDGNDADNNNNEKEENSAPGPAVKEAVREEHGQNVSIVKHEEMSIKQEPKQANAASAVIKSEPMDNDEEDEGEGQDEDEDEAARSALIGSAALRSRNASGGASGASGTNNNNSSLIIIHQPHLSTHRELKPETKFELNPHTSNGPMSNGPMSNGPMSGFTDGTDGGTDGGTDETREFRRDLDRHADDVDVESDVYAMIPIGEFGMAMLRGMGWTGGSGSNGGGSNGGGSNGGGNGGSNSGGGNGGIQNGGIQNGRGGKGSKGGAADDLPDSMKPRHHRLGLGAAPASFDVRSSSSLSSSTGHTKPGSRHRAHRPHELAKLEQQQRHEDEFRKQLQERERLDRQRTLQVGSIVRVRSHGDTTSTSADNSNGEPKKKKKKKKKEMERAVVVQTAGVPGLNQIRIRYEGTSEPMSIRKGDAVLVEQAEVDHDPFRHPAENIGSDEGGKREEGSYEERDGRNNGKARNGLEEEKKEAGGAEDWRGGDRGRDWDRARNRDRDRDRRDRDRDRHRHREQNSRREDKYRESKDKERGRDRYRDRDRDRHRDRRARRDRDEDGQYESSRDRKRSKKESGGRGSSDHRRSEPAATAPPSASSTCWLTPNIRVRLITKKLASGRQYKEKGVVLDVLPGGTRATVQMSDGEVLDKVPDRYLETALPKVGGNVIVLACDDAQHRYAKGRLLERQSDRGRGVLQLFEDMNVLTLSLDDIAEWCGPLDPDDMMT